MDKKLYRSSRDRVLFGVCGGIAEYFGIDPVIVRLLTVLFAFTGSGVLFYIVAAVIMNEAPGYARDTQYYDYSGGQSPPDNSETYSSDFINTEKPQHEKQAYKQAGKRPGILIFGLILVAIGLFILAGLVFPVLFRLSFKLIFAVVLVSLGIYFVVKH